MFSSREKNIRKAFTTLKSHASAVANFTLQWQELEDHFLSIHKSIQSKLHQLQTTPKLNPPPPPPLTILQTPLLTPKHLLIFLNSQINSRETYSLRDTVRDALRTASHGRIVLDAMRYFYDTDDLGLGGPGPVRKSCVYLLEEFVRAKNDVEEQVKEDARSMALEWRGRVKCAAYFTLEIQAFFLLVIGFGLTVEFKYEDLVGLLETVATMRGSTELFRGLGFSDKAEDFIQKLIGQNKRLEAIRFIHEFELVDKFPMVPLIKEHLNYIQKTSKANPKVVKKSRKDEVRAINSEKSALRATCRIIEKYNIQYSIDSIGTKVKHLIRQKRKKNPSEISEISNEPQQKIGKKRKSPAPSARPNRKCENRRPQTVVPAEVDVNGMVTASNASRLTHSLYHQPTSLLSLQEPRYFTSSARMSSPPPASLHAYAGSASHIYSMQSESHYKPGSFTAQSAEQFSPSAGRVPIGATSSYYSTHLSQYDQEPYRKQLTARPAPAHYNLTASLRDASYAGILDRTSGLSSSLRDGRYSSPSLRLYETSSLATETDERFGLVRIPYSSGVSPYVNSSTGASPRKRSYCD